MTYRTRQQYAYASAHGQHEEAERLLRIMIADWLTPKKPDYNDLLPRLIAAHERKEQRKAIDDNQWDQQHEGANS